MRKRAPGSHREIERIDGNRSDLGQGFCAFPDVGLKSSFNLDDHLHAAIRALAAGRCLKEAIDVRHAATDVEPSAAARARIEDLVAVLWLVHRRVTW